ncbi:MAG: hypothetical protein IJW40_00835 [Clostridia bacterium]|nr:hypothetical protein [Clostridia bacterium]
MKKLLCLLLALLMCMSMLVACATDDEGDDTKEPDASGDGTEDGADGQEPTTEEDPWLDDLPDTTLGGIELVIAYFAKNGIKDGLSVDAEENNGDLINDSMYDRNTAVEERFDVELIGNSVTPGGGITSVVTPVLTSGATDYDILVGYQYYDIGLAATGLMYNINNLANDYLNIENPWWSTDYINNINYSDKLYWLTGDVTLAHIGTIAASYVNAAIYTEYCEDDYGPLYEIVRDKEWTFELMIMMAEDAYHDANGNDKYDSGDQFGFINSLGVEMAYCAGINSSVRDEEGNITIAIDDDRTAEIMWYLNEIWTSKVAVSNDTEQGQYQIFASGEGMIYFRDLMAAEDQLFRNMEDDFYIVPIPMGDDYFCEDYRSTCMTGNNIVGLAHTSLYLEESALVLEALAAESYRSVTPVYYDTILKDRYTRDNESKEMIDMVREKVGVDFVNTWSFGYTDAYNFYLTFDSGTVASRIATYAPQWEKILGNLLEKLDNLE